MWLLSAAYALPSIEEPARTGASAPADSAVIIGIEDYYTLPPVPYAERDADAFYDFAIYTRGIPATRVKRLIGTVSREQIVAAISEMGRQTGASGTVFVYFAGHGAASPVTGERILIGADAQSDLETFQARSIALSEIERSALSGGGQVVFVLDTCWSGRLRSGGELLPGKRFAVPTYADAAPSKVTEWTAAGPDQWSGPLPEARHGAFTYLAIGALRGWADGQRNGTRDGAVTAEEAALYVEEGLRELGLSDQRPTFRGNATAVLSRGNEPKPSALTAPAVKSVTAPAPVTQLAASSAGSVCDAVRVTLERVEPLGTSLFLPDGGYELSIVVENQNTTPIELPSGDDVTILVGNQAFSTVMVPGMNYWFHPLTLGAGLSRQLRVAIDATQHEQPTGIDIHNVEPEGIPFTSCTVHATFGATGASR